MSEDKLERILATYEPVKGKPGYVWVSKDNNTIVKLSILREAYEEHFAEGAGEIDDKNVNNQRSCS